jgi:predicted MPP superfamily phosphohydrolase
MNAYFIETKHIVVPMDKLQKNMTIVQLSDVHLGAIHNTHFLKRVVDKTNGLNPDAVLITGDLFDGGGVLDGDIAMLLNGFKAETFFTTGNHERYAGLDNAMAVLNKTKIRVLQNEAVDYKGIQIVGIGDTYDDFTRPNDFVSKIAINKSLPTILMYHQPTGIKEANEAGIDLQLSGHTHYGQFFPINLIVMVLSRYPYGLHDYNGTKIYVTSGVGTWGPPMRLCSRNEIVVIHLVPKNVPSQVTPSGPVPSEAQSPAIPQIS